MSEGFFFPDQTPDQTALARRQALADAMLQRGVAPPGNSAGAGLSNAGSQIVGALLAKRLGDKAKDLETQREGSYSKALGNFLSPFNYGGAPNADTGIPDDVNVSPQASADNAGSQGSSMGSRLAATGNTDLQRQIAPQVLAQALQANAPITPYQQAELAQQQRVTDPDYLARVKALPGPAAQAKPQDVIDQENAQADLASGRQLQNATTLKGVPDAPSSGMSQEAFKQAEDLARVKAEESLKAQMGDANDIEAMASGIANYKTAPLSGFAMSKPAGMAIMARAQQINPNYNAQNFTKSQQAYKDFGSGKKGDLTRSFNVSISHLGTLDKLTDALGNGDTQTLNQIRNSFKEQFGSEAPTNFNAAKAIVGDEIIKAIVGSGGALADRENAANQISAAKTPGQLKGVIKTYKELMAGQLKGLKQQYNASTMRGDFDTLLSPEAKAELESAGGKAPSGTVAPAAAKSAAQFRYDANGNRVSQ